MTSIAKGNRVPYTPSGGDVDAGDVVELVSMIGVATEPIQDGETGSLAIEGVFVLPKLDTLTAISQGEAVKWGAGGVTNLSGISIGYAWAAAGRFADSITVKLKP